MVSGCLAAGTACDWRGRGSNARCEIECTMVQYFSMVLLVGSTGVSWIEPAVLN